MSVGTHSSQRCCWRRDCHWAVGRRCQPWDHALRSVPRRRVHPSVRRPSCLQKPPKFSTFPRFLCRVCVGKIIHFCQLKCLSFKRVCFLRGAGCETLERETSLFLAPWTATPDVPRYSNIFEDRTELDTELDRKTALPPMCEKSQPIIFTSVVFSICKKTRHAF